MSSRCGSNANDTSGNCGVFCSSKSDCSQGESCFGALDTKVCNSKIPLLFFSRRAKHC